MRQRYEGVWSCTFICDGARTMGQMMSRLKETYEQLRDMRQAGIKLQWAVKNGDAFLVTDNAAAADEFGLEQVEDGGSWDEDDALGDPPEADPDDLHDDGSDLHTEPE